MESNYTLLKSKKMSKGIQIIDLWSLFYLLIVYIFTITFNQANMIIFAVYFLCAIPFINHLDKFTCICFLLSTMSYYFLGAEEGVWSLYSILAIMMVLHLFANGIIKLQFKTIICFFWMIVAVILSYMHSPFGYIKGMYAMVYNILIAILISITIKFNKDTIMHFLPKIATFQLIVCLFFLLINGYYDGYGFSISEKINHNTFGASMSIISVILAAKILFFNGDKFIYKFALSVSFILIVISGSRNALMAMILTSVLMYVFSIKYRGKTITGSLKFLLFVCTIVLVGALLLPEVGIDLERYNYIKLINSGGSNRAIIWKTLFPVIFNNYKMFGYGPSHFCSEKIINLFMNLDYKHTHNTIFEAWGELGFFGLVPFVFIILNILKRFNLVIKNKNYYSMFGFMFIEFLLLGLGESFFAKIEMWIIMGILCCSKKNLVIDNDIKCGEK